MTITEINNEKEYQKACEHMDAFLEKHADELDHLSEKADNEFRLLALVIKEYEDKHFPVSEKIEKSPGVSR